MNHRTEIYTQAEKKRQLSKLCSQIPLADHGICHSLCDKPQGSEYNALSVLCIPHTQGSGSVSTNTHNFSVASLLLKSNVCGRCKTFFIISFPSYALKWAKWSRTAYCNYFSRLLPGFQGSTKLLQHFGNAGFVFSTKYKVKNPILKS